MQYSLAKSRRIGLLESERLGSLYVDHVDLFESPALALMCFRCDVECDLGTTNAFLGVAGLADLLRYIHDEFDIELTACFHERLDIVLRVDSVHSWSKAGPKELVLEFLADDGVVSTAESEDVHAASDLGVPKQCGTGHRVVPVPVESLEWEHGGERARIKAFHIDAGTCCVGKPDH